MKLITAHRYCDGSEHIYRVGLVDVLVHCNHRPIYILTSNYETVFERLVKQNSSYKPMHPNTRVQFIPTRKLRVTTTDTI